MQNTLRTNLENSLKDKGFLISNRISVFSAEPILTGDRNSLRKIVTDNKASIKDISYIFIVNENNHVIIHTFDRGFPLQLLWANILSSNDKFSVKQISLDGEQIFDVAVPITIANYTIGFTHVGVSLNLIKDSIREFKVRTTLITLLLLFLGIFFTFRITQGIIKPVKKLQEITEGIAETENLDQPVLIKSGDEMERLAVSFDKMREKLKVSRDNIENKIEERTYELQLEIRDREKKEAKLNKIANELKNAYKELENSQIAALNIMEDLTGAKAELENEKHKLIEQQDELKKINEELDNFVYVASHDLRAPLRGISSYASFLFEDCAEFIGEDGKNYIEQIKESARRMDALLNDLLTLSRVSRIKNPYSETDINQLLNEIIESLAFEIKQFNITFTVEKDIPVIFCDRVKIYQVFSNLLDNAIKFLIKENKRPKIKVTFEEKAGHYEFSVKDNGIGIPEEFFHRIFEPFTRLHPQQAYKGTGVGLNIVKKIIEEHGGEIWVDSTPGKGATFIFSIPKKR